MLHNNANVFRVAYTSWQQYHLSTHKAWVCGKLEVYKDKKELRYQPKEMQLFDQILYVRDGAIAIISNGKRLLIKHGSCCTIPAGVEFALYPENINDLTSHYIISFPVALSDKVTDFISFPDQGYMSNTWLDPFILDKTEQAYIQKRLDLFIHPPLGHELIDKNILIPSLNILVYDLVIIAFFADQTKESETLQTLPPWLRKLCSQMKRPKHFTHGAKEMERLSGKSATYLYRVFAKYFGITPLDFVNQQKGVYAAEKLTHTNQDIVSISEDIGFTSLSYFYRFFKKYYNISPAAYRKSARLTQNFTMKHEDNEGSS